MTMLPFIGNNQHLRIVRSPLYVFPRRAPSHGATLVITPRERGTLDRLLTILPP
uniref:WRKY transcription factor 84 n=1 Tax=Rhizophora mucronata TaxID=61149 RepID=A0A2P2IMA3_RHIMU